MDDSKSVQRKVKCGTVALQQLRRIALPTVITENLDLREGDHLTLYYDPDTKAAILTKAEASKSATARAPGKRIRVQR